MDEKELQELGYAFPRQLPDGRWIAIQVMLYTTGLFVGLDPVGYAYRYCYESFGEAVLDAALRWNGDGDPPGPWIKRKGLGGDLLNPRWLAEAKDEIG